MSETNKYIRNISIMGNDNVPVSGNSPSEYASRQTPYLANRTRLFNSQRAYLASDYVTANVQGLTNDFYTWTQTNIRLSNVSTSKSTSWSANKTDDVKSVLFPDVDITYFPIGAKIETMGSTWLCINPDNISSPDATAIVMRCNASYNSYDNYGNVVTEPIIVQRAEMSNNNSDTPLNIVLMQGYFNIICQKNDNTSRLGENKRIILGSKAYHITGFTDFIEEFSGDRNSAHLLTFTVRVEEPTVSDDTSVNYIAEGNNYSFAAHITGPSMMLQGEQAQLTAEFIVNGEQSTMLTDWQWSSSNHQVVKIDQNGMAEAVGEGSTIVSVTLQQNHNITASLGIAVSEQALSPVIKFEGDIPGSLRQYSTITLSAVYYNADGNPVAADLNWSAQGDDTSYAMTVSQTEQSATITCLEPSDTPLQITVSHENIQASVSIRMEGY